MIKLVNYFKTIKNLNLKGSGLAGAFSKNNFNCATTFLLINVAKRVKSIYQDVLMRKIF